MLRGSVKRGVCERMPGVGIAAALAGKTQNVAETFLAETSQAMKKIVLCADDFAMTDGVSRGILDLVAMGRLSATSVMTNGPVWREVAPDLRAVDGRIACGLHVNLTSGKPLGPMRDFAANGTFPALGAVLGAAVRRSLPAAEIESEIERQFTAFAEHFGRMPDFVDGHQHAHVLPGIRGPMLRAAKAAALGPRSWLRDPSDRVTAVLARRASAPKAFTINALAVGFRSAARQAGFKTNEGFSGFSDFAAGRDLESDFGGFLTALGPRPVVMCHPGKVGSDRAGLDEVVEARERELAYLASDAFAWLLAERRIELSPVLDRIVLM